MSPHAVDSQQQIHEGERRVEPQQVGSEKENHFSSVQITAETLNPSEVQVSTG